MTQQERRRFLRVPCENLINYSLMNEGGVTGKSSFGYVHCKNVSLIGVLFTAFEPISPGTMLKLQLQLDITEKNFEDITMFGSVVRCEKIKSAETWDIATSIMSMLETKKRLIFVNWLANKDDEYNFS